MAQSNPSDKIEKTAQDADKNKVTPLRCLLGSSIAGTLATLLYFLTYSIAVTFAHKPLTSTNQIALRISAAVRTLVVGVASLGTFIFAFVAFGLVLLAIQLTIQGISQRLKQNS